MTRRCERPGCAELASLSFRFDPRRRIVELFPGVAESDNEAGALCRRHGDAMVLPRGWVLDDQRDLMPRLFSVDRNSDTSGNTTGGRRRRQRGRVAPIDPGLFVVDDEGDDDMVDPGEVASTDASTDQALTVAQVAGAHPETRPDETRAMPWVPTFDASDNLGGVLDATTPLLRKAFGTDHRERRR
jgi:hypothetical protein